MSLGEIFTVVQLETLIQGKKFATTDRTSNKNARFKAQFADLKPQKKQADEEVKKAEEELLKDDDSLPVKDEQVKNACL